MMQNYRNLELPNNMRNCEGRKEGADIGKMYSLICILMVLMLFLNRENEVHITLVILLKQYTNHRSCKKQTNKFVCIQILNSCGPKKL